MYTTSGSPACQPVTDKDAGLRASSASINAAFTRCLGTASLQKAYNTWLHLNKGVAIWADLERWVSSNCQPLRAISSSGDAYIYRLTFSLILSPSQKGPPRCRSWLAC